LKINAVLAGLFLFSVASAIDLNQSIAANIEEAVFNRCYAHLTGKRPALDHPLLAEVKAGSKTAVEACMSVFDKALLGANGRIANTSDEEAKAVLANFHSYHRKWFAITDINLTLADGCTRTSTYLDEQESALFITRSMFGRNSAGDPFPYSDIVTLGESLQAVRSNTSSSLDLLAAELNVIQNAAGNYVLSTLAKTPLSGPRAELGDLYGVKIATAERKNFQVPMHQSLNATTGATSISKYGSLALNLGGGVIGSQPYLLMNSGLGTNRFADGAAKMSRRWSRNLLTDIMCRDLPVIRKEDALIYIQPTITADTPAFRGNADCMQCHASIDNMARTIRNIRSTRNLNCRDIDPHPVRGGKVRLGTSLIEYLTPTLNEIGTTDGDCNNTGSNNVNACKYPHRRPLGSFVFRTHDGKLIEKSIEGPGQLGQALAETEDLYACASARYTKFFTGVDVKMADFNGAATPLNPEQNKAKKFVVDLGKKLKSHQSLRTLILDIISSDLYKQDLVKRMGASK